jgi:hypothetical protein
LGVIISAVDAVFDVTILRAELVGHVRMVRHSTKARRPTGVRGIVVRSLLEIATTVMLDCLLRVAHLSLATVCWSMDDQILSLSIAAAEAEAHLHVGLTVLAFRRMGGGFS